MDISERDAKRLKSKKSDLHKAGSLYQFKDNFKFQNCIEKAEENITKRDGATGKKVRKVRR